MSKIDFDKVGFGTMSIHAGQSPDPSYGALATPIFQTSTFCFDTVEAGTAIFSKETPGYAYTRGENPTTNALMIKLAHLEKGEACITMSSGMGAIGSVFVAFLKAGDHVICGSCVYGCTAYALTNMFSQFGVETSYVDTSDIDAVEKAITDKTRIIFFETPTNPTMQITDIAAVSVLAHKHNIKVVVDNTFAPSPIQYPLELGADIIVHSLTKYINGHGDIIGGAAIGSREDIAKVTGAAAKFCGATPSPFNSFLVLRGMQTMELRMERHCKNGLALAKYLEAHPMVENVYYPGLESNPQYELAQKQMNGLYSGILSVELKDGINGMDSFTACKKVVNALKVASIAVSLGDPETLVQHPASMTHSMETAEERAAMKITDNMIRISVGLENTEDIIADFEQAFNSVK